MHKLLGLVGSVSSPSKTRAAVEVVLDAASSTYGDVETDVLHLADYDLVTADGRGLDAYTGDTAEVLSKIVASDAFVIGTPVYRAAYSGALKNLLDMVPRGMWQADVAPLAGSAVALVAAGATPHHYLAVEKELAPVLGFFGAHLVGSGAYLWGEHFGDEDSGEGGDESGSYAVTDAAARTRLETLGRGTVELARALDASDHLATLGPQF